MINNVIRSRESPKTLKTTQILPIRKKDKESTSSDGWRPVNIIPALSKIIERVLLTQMMKHLQDNQIIKHSHHGGTQGKSTQSLIAEVYDNLLESLNNGQDVALLIIDQSKAFDIVDHPILLQKLQVIGYKNQPIQIMKSYLSERKQYVHVNGKRSENLLLGPRSVMQGSSLSGILYLIYMADMTEIFHAKNHTPEQMRNCNKENMKTFVDNAYVKVPLVENENPETTIMKTLTKIKEYTDANRLAMNPEKTQVMIVTKDNNKKSNFKLKIK